MDNYVWWFVIGFGLVVAELLTGTFYLLVIAIAFGAAGVAALVDAPDALAGAWLAADGEAVATPELVRRVAAVLGVTPRLPKVPPLLLALAAAATGRGALLRRTVSSLEVDALPLVRRIGALPFTLDQGLAATAAWWRLRHAI